MNNTAFSQSVICEGKHFLICQLQCSDFKGHIGPMFPINLPLIPVQDSERAFKFLTMLVDCCD